MIQTTAQGYRRDRRVVIAGIVLISLLSWAYMVVLANPGPTDLSPGQAVMQPAMTAWNGGLLVLSMVMWSVMMIAMMLPTATPMVLAFTRLQHQHETRPQAVRLTASFSTGYLLAWVAFSVIAALGQWALYSIEMMTSAMGSTTPLVAGSLLVAAGLFQWSTLKDACLTKCRSPIDFLMNEWRPGRKGALVMGLRHGLFCVGCCWILMLLMFVGGVMNLTWMAAITIYVLLEKVIPSIRLFSSAIGVLLVLAGAVTIGLSLAW